MREIEFYETSSGSCPVEEYIQKLNIKQAEKVYWVLNLIQTLDRVPTEYFKKLVNTDDIWEVRIQQGNNIFRLLGFYDGNNLVILDHAFTKKTQKTPPQAIKLAEQRKQEYFERKKK